MPKEILETTYIQITLARLEELEAAQNKLLALEAAGVDNWEGYDSAMDILSEMNEEDDD